jgi:hypothetical protein
MAAWTNCAVAVQLSGRRLGDLLEYTVLEALDSGAAVVMPRYYLPPGHDRAGYNVHLLDHYGRAAQAGRKKPIVWSDEQAANELTSTIIAAINDIETGAHDPLANQVALQKYHAPKILAGKILEIV